MSEKNNFWTYLSKCNGIAIFIIVLVLLAGIDNIFKYYFDASKLEKTQKHERVMAIEELNRLEILGDSINGECQRK